MSKMANRTPMKTENKGPGDHRRESGGGRNDRGDKSNSHSRSESSSRNKHSDNPPKGSHDDGDKHTHTSENKSSEEKKFTGRCRLFVGNLTPDVTEDDFKKMFEPYGEVSEVYVNTSRGFGFIRLDYRQNAEAAKAALDGLQRKGRVLRVRFATHGAALKVKNLHHYVSNELLEQAFTQFGELERAIVIVDDRGKPTGEALVEFVRKPGAQQALRRINEGVFLFGADPKPIEVEPLEQKDEEDGMPEKFLPKNEQYKKEREKEPHFAAQGSFEYEFGMRWKQLDELEKKRIDNVKKEMEEARIKLEDEMQNALYEYQAEQIRQDLIRQQEELRRLEELRNADRMRRQQELEMRTMSRRAEEERTRAQDDRRRQELMMRQQEMQRRSGGGPMDSVMSQRSREELMGGNMRGGPEGPGGFASGPSGMGMRGGQNQGQGGGDPQMRGGRGGAPPMQPPPAPPAGMGLERGQQPGMGRVSEGQRYAEMMQQGGGGGQGQGFGGQGGMPGSGGQGGGNPSGGGSPSINNLANMGGQGGQGGQGNQMDTDTWDSHHDWSRDSPGFYGDPPRSTPSQFEDAEDDPRPNDSGHWQAPPYDERGSYLNGDASLKEMGPSRKRLLRESELREWDDIEGERAYDNSESRTWNSECGVDDSGSVDRVGLYNEGDVADDGSSLPRRQWSDSVVNGELYSGGGDSSAQHTRCDNPHTQHSELSGPLSTSLHSPHNPAEMNHSQPQKSPYTDTLVPYETSQNTPQHEPQGITQHTSFCENELHDMQSSAMETSFNDDQNQMYSDYRGEDLIVGDQESLYYGEDLIAGGSGGEQDFYQGSNLMAGVGDGGEDVYEDFAAGDGHIDYILSYSDAQSSLADQALTDTDVPEPSSVIGKGEEDISLGREGADSSLLEGGDLSAVEGADSSMVESVDNSTEERQGVDSFIEEGAGSNSMAVMPYMSPVGSLSVGSPCPSPPVSPPNRPGPSVQAAAATGVPLQPTPMTLGAPRFIPVHPVHVAAAVAAQRSRAAAALMQQHTRMAAAAVAAQQQQAAAVVAQQQQAAAQQRAAAAAVHQRVASAAVQQQAAAAAAAVHQQQAAVRVAAAVHQRQAAAVAAQAQHRTRAALMQQQLVRSRYMGAPVLVRPPFLPAGPRVAAPIRVRMRVRRSVMMTEELSVDHP